MNLPLTGGCLCGAVRYEITVEPVLMLKCHCRDCQRISGGPYVPAMIFPHAGFRVTQGGIRKFATDNEDGSFHLRGFCETCGSRLTGAEDPDRGIIGVVASSLDDPGIFRPGFEIYVGDAQAWDFMDPSTTKFQERFPGIREGS